MAEDQDRSQNTGKATWLKIFTGFKLALDPKKLLLAGAGIFVTFLGWWMISIIFFSFSHMPDASEFETDKETGKAAYHDSFLRWTLLYELASDPRETTVSNVKKVLEDTGYKDLADSLKERHGLLRFCPWEEDRGPNQLTVAAQAVRQHGDFKVIDALKKYSNFVVEPLYKFLLPVTYFFDSRAGGLFSRNRVFLIMILLWTVFTWGFFGGAITRIVAVQFARNEKVGLLESLKFVCARWQSYLFAPLLPLVLLIVIGLTLCVFGLVIGWIPGLGELMAGLLWPLSLIAGLIMAVVLVGLVGWPLMNATISTEGSDSFDALSRSYSYIFQVPWHCLGYALLSIAYGAVLVFFVGFMSTLLVYLGKWGVNQAPVRDDRDPAYLFMYAPGSFGWRDTLLEDSPHKVFKETIPTDKKEVPAVTDKKLLVPVTESKDGHFELKLKEKDKGQFELELKEPAAQEKKNHPVPERKGAHYELKTNGDYTVTWYNKVGMYLVTFWLGLFFLLILGFGYSYFWSAAGIIYMLVRQKVDDTDLDEVFLEEDPDQPFVPENPPPAIPSGAPPVLSRRA